MSLFIKDEQIITLGELSLGGKSSWIPYMEISAYIKVKHLLPFILKYDHKNVSIRKSLGRRDGVLLQCEGQAFFLPIMEGWGFLSSEFFCPNETHFVKTFRWTQLSHFPGTLK